jgi:lipid-A-disaccharide synthase-like uncharacterized protein
LSGSCGSSASLIACETNQRNTPSRTHKYDDNRNHLARHRIPWQGLFFGRWVIQWIASERKAESQVPIAFWYMSLIGGLITLAYAIYRKDPVFIAGQSIGAVVYIRNLILISRANQAKHLASPSSPQS